MTKSDDTTGLDFDKIAKDSLTYLENMIEFLRVWGEKIPEKPRKEIILRIASDLEVPRNRLVKLLKRRQAQINKHTTIEVSFTDMSFLELITRGDFFRKSHWGEITARRVVSFEEGTQKAIDLGLLGLVYFTHLPQQNPRSYLRWMGAFLPTFRTQVKTLLECHNRDNRNIRSG